MKAFTEYRVSKMFHICIIYKACDKIYLFYLIRARQEVNLHAKINRKFRIKFSCSQLRLSRKRGSKFKYKSVILDFQLIYPVIPHVLQHPRYSAYLYTFLTFCIHFILLYFQFTGLYFEPAYMHFRLV